MGRGTSCGFCGSGAASRRQASCRRPLLRARRRPRRPRLRRLPLPEMAKLIAAAAVVVGLLFYAFHSHGASAAKVGSCLAKRGATVERSRFLEEAFGLTADGQQRPDGLK